MSWALSRWRARRSLRLPGPRRWLARRRGAEGADAEGGGHPFSASKASPRAWSVSRSMGSDHERPWVKVLPLSLLCAGLLIWCAFREKRRSMSGWKRCSPADRGLLRCGPKSNAPLQPQEDK